MANPIQLILMITALAIIISIAILGRKTFSLLGFNEAKTPNTESTWIMIITGLLTIIMAIGSYISKKPEIDSIMWIGISTYTIGIILQIIIKKQTTDKLQEQIENGVKGLYKKIRHPSKTAVILIITGICLATKSWWALGINIILFIPSTFYRISQEEKTLSDEYSEKWTIYKNQTKKLIPKIL